MSDAQSKFNSEEQRRLQNINQKLYDIDLQFDRRREDGSRVFTERQIQLMDGLWETLSGIPEVRGTRA